MWGHYHSDANNCRRIATTYSKRGPKGPKFFPFKQLAIPLKSGSSGHQILGQVQILRWIKVSVVPGFWFIQVSPPLSLSTYTHTHTQTHTLYLTWRMYKYAYELLWKINLSLWIPRKQICSIYIARSALILHVFSVQGSDCFPYSPNKWLSNPERKIWCA
jgi:hypothetical protein